MLRPAASARRRQSRLLRRIREASIGAVGMDGLEALRRHLEPGERRLRLEAGTPPPPQIPDEPRPRGGALPDGLLLGPPEHGGEGGKGGRFHEGEEGLESEENRR